MRQIPQIGPLVIDFVSTLQAVRDTAPNPSPSEFDVEYIAEDGMRHNVPLPDAAEVRFAAMAPTRRFKALKGAASPAWTLVVGG